MTPIPSCRPGVHSRGHPEPLPFSGRRGHQADAIAAEQDAPPVADCSAWDSLPRRGWGACPAGEQANGLSLNLIHRDNWRHPAGSMGYRWGVGDV